MKKTFKTLLALLMVLTLVCALFVPVFADDASGEDDPGEEETDAPTEAPTEEPTEEPTEAPTEAEDEGGEDGGACGTATELEVCYPDPCGPVSGGEDTCDEWKFEWEECIEFIKDYSKSYKLGTVTVGECSKLKAYILREDGTIYNSAIGTESVNVHHGTKWNLTWNGLDDNGTHPAGTWNNPTKVRFTIIIVATCINGHDHICSAVFNYCFYDTMPEKGAAAPSAPGAGAGAPKSNDVPHTGL